MHPFGNSLVTVTLTGAQLHQALEEQWGEDRVRFLQPSSSLRYVYHDEAVGTMDEGTRPVRLGRIELRPAIELAETGRPRPTQERLDHLVGLAHEQCYIAASLRTEVVVEARFSWRG